MRFLSLLLLVICCQSFQQTSASSESVFFLTRLDQPLDEEWRHHRFVNETLYTLVTEEGKRAIRAVGQESSSGLYKEFHYSLKEYPWLEWEWKVENVHKTTNLAIKEKEDMALGVFLIFPHPWIPWKTKTLAYVWSSPNHRPGEIVSGPYHPYVVLEAGEEKKGHWIKEKRNAYEDYKLVHGKYPEQPVEALAFFTDNDQTREPASGFYGPVKDLTGNP